MTISYPYALPPNRYRALLEQDYLRLRSLVDVAATAPVPACEGWDGREVALHTAAVYLHKATTMRTGGEAPFPRESFADDAGPGEMLDAAWQSLVAELDTRDLDSFTPTWWSEDQTVGFWLRRMTHETAIHRHDMETAAGQPTLIDDDLAIDGIDEVLDVLLRWDWEDTPAPGATGATIRVNSGDHTWTVALDPRQAVLDRAGHGTAQAEVRGDPNTVLLWLWGAGDRSQQPADIAPPSESSENVCCSR